MLNDQAPYPSAVIVDSEGLLLTTETIFWGKLLSFHAETGVLNIKVLSLFKESL